MFASAKHVSLSGLNAYIKKVNAHVNKANKKNNIPDIGIGERSLIRRAIIDKNARIGKDVSIGMGKTPDDGDYGFYHVVDGIYVIPKNACVMDGTVI